MDMVRKMLIWRNFFPLKINMMIKTHIQAKNIREGAEFHEFHEMQEIEIKQCNEEWRGKLKSF